MTPEEEKTLAALEKTVSEFNLVTSGLNVQGNFGAPLDPKKATPMERLQHLEKMHANFQIVGGANVTVEGSITHGFAICSTCPGESQGTSTLPVNVITTINGACCFEDGSCSITNSAACVSAGGTYQGDGTDCDPNPCPPAGACCREEVCTIETQASCEGDGGIYQGDDTTCEPNPCTDTGACCIGVLCSVQSEEDCDNAGGSYLGDGSTCDPCPCGECDSFPGFDDMGNFYLVQTYHFTRTANQIAGPGIDGCDSVVDITTTTTITVEEDGTCSTDVTCSGSASFTSDSESDTCNWVEFGGGCHYEDEGLCVALCHEGCASGCTTSVIDTDTEQSCTCHFEDSGGTVDLSETITLSSPFTCT